MRQQAEQKLTKVSNFAGRVALALTAPGFKFISPHVCKLPTDVYVILAPPARHSLTCLWQVQRQHAAVDAQLRQALERGARLQRERKHLTAESRSERVTVLLRRSLDVPFTSWKLLGALWHWRSITYQLLPPERRRLEASRQGQGPNPVAALWGRFVNSSPGRAAGD